MLLKFSSFYFLLIFVINYFLAYYIFLKDMILDLFYFLELLEFLEILFFEDVEKFLLDKLVSLIGFGVKIYALQK